MARHSSTTGRTEFIVEWIEHYGGPRQLVGGPPPPLFSCPVFCRITHRLQTPIVWTQTRRARRSSASSVSGCSSTPRASPTSRSSKSSRPRTGGLPLHQGGGQGDEGCRSLMSRINRGYACLCLCNESELAESLQGKFLRSRTQTVP